MICRSWLGVGPIKEPIFDQGDQFYTKSAAEIAQLYYEYSDTRKEIQETLKMVRNHPQDTRHVNLITLEKSSSLLYNSKAEWNKVQVVDYQIEKQTCPQA
jgi:dsDNA-specific endonuclease/ATPase MutS2